MDGGARSFSLMSLSLRHPADVGLFLDPLVPPAYCLLSGIMHMQSH